MWIGCQAVVQTIGCRMAVCTHDRLQRGSTPDRTWGSCTSARLYSLGGCTEIGCRVAIQAIGCRAAVLQSTVRLAYSVAVW